MVEDSSQQKNPDSELLRLARKVDLLEECHNEVLDIQHTTNKRLKSFKTELHTKVGDELRKAKQLRSEIDTRLKHIDRIPVLLSLLAREEEVAPLSSRIDATSYEFFAQRTWFASQLKSAKDSK